MSRLSLTFSLLLAACSGQRTDGPVPHWTLVEELRIGGADTGKASFTSVVDYKFDPSGKIWILDHETQEIRIFGRDGGFIRAIGRQGEGPGEIVATNGFAFGPGGALWVPDYRLSRYNLFDTTGRFIASHGNLIDSYGWRWFGGVDPQGRLFDQIYVRVDTNRIAALRRFRDTSLSVADTLPLPSCASGPLPYYQLTAKNGYSRGPVPFAPTEVLQIAGDRAWCSSGATSSAVAIDLAHGDTLARISYERPRLQVGPAARDSAIANIHKRAMAMGATDPDFSQIPALQPAIIGLAVDDGGRVWLRVPDPAVTRFDLFDRHGGRLAEVTTPLKLLRFAPLAFRGDTLLATVTDADDVPVVVRLHIDRGTATH
jgi:hypothetical protein